MAQDKVLSVGIRSTSNLGDVAISEMIFKLLQRRGYQVVRMEFNFSAVVAGCRQADRFWRGSGRCCDNTKPGLIPLFSGRVAKAIGRVFKLAFYLPAVFLVFWRNSKGCAKVFIGGGNLLMGIEYGFPIQVLCYVLFSRLLGKRVVFVCVGAGPFTAPGVKPILRLVLRLSQRVICRDSKSKELIERELGDSLVVLEVFPDPVLLWPKVKEKTKISYDILFTVMPLFSPAIFPDGDYPRAENFQTCMIDLWVELIKSGKRIGVFVTDSKVDLKISKTIAKEVFNRTGVSLVVELPITPEEMAVLVNSADVVFSTRMHGAIMALSQTVPSLCISWQPKINGLYSYLAINDLLVALDVFGRFSTQDALHKLSKISENRNYYLEVIGQRLTEVEGLTGRLWASL